MCRPPSRLSSHSTFTVRPARGPVRARPSMALCAADVSSAMSRIREAILHSRSRVATSARWVSVLDPACVQLDSELLGRYSNWANWTNLSERVRRYHQPERPETSSRRGTVRRLSAEQIAQLTDLYKAGATINDLAKYFKIHRTTVSLHLLRQGVRDRRRL